MFLTVGLGLAAPYLLLSCQPSWLKFLPKPGAWMARFKVAMGFPMLATAVWIFSLSLDYFGAGAAFWLGALLVAIALVAWIWGEFVQRGSRQRGWAMVVSIALLTVTYCYILEGQLHWRKPVAATPGACTSVCLASRT